MPDNIIADQQEKISGPNYACNIQVRWSDFDQFGYVNNAAYLNYAEQCRVQFFRDRWIRAGIPTPTVAVRHMEIDYLKPILPETESVRLELTVKNIGKTSYSLRYTVVDHNGDINCVIDCVMVVFDIATRQPLELSSGDRLMLTGQVVESAVLTDI